MAESSAKAGQTLSRFPFPAQNDKCIELYIELNSQRIVALFDWPSKLVFNILASNSGLKRKVFPPKDSMWIGWLIPKFCC